MRANLDRSVAAVLHHQRHPLTTRVQLDRGAGDDDFARYHAIGPCTVTSFVPAGEVASTWTESIISGMPGSTSSWVSTERPDDISSAMVRPSWAPSRTNEVM